MISRGLIRFVCGFALLAAALPGRPLAAQAVTGLVPLLQVESSGITERSFDIFFCDVCDTRKNILETRQLTIFTNRSLVGVASANDLGDPDGPTSSAITGVGSVESFDQLVAALAAARPLSGAPGCSFSFRRNPRPPRPDSIVSEVVNHDYRLTWYDGNTVRTFVIDSTQPRCPVALRALAYETVQYFETVVGQSLTTLWMSLPAR